MTQKKRNPSAALMLTRRSFLHSTVAAGALLSGGPVVKAVRGEPSGKIAGSDALERAFRDPPDESKPWAYWWWLNGDVSREGITRDLQEMKRQGINGVLVFQAGADVGVPKGPGFLSLEWIELFQFAVQEAARLGMEMSVNLCDGWNAGRPVDRARVRGKEAGIFRGANGWAGQEVDTFASAADCRWLLP